MPRATTRSHIAAGVYPEAVTATIPLHFIGVGASTPPATGAGSVETGTFVDAGAQHAPAFTLGDHDASFTDLAVRGGVASDGKGGEVLPAIRGGGASAPSVVLFHVLVEQSDPINPDRWDYAIGLANGAGTAQLTVDSSTVDGYQAAIGVTDGTGGWVGVVHSTVTVPDYPASTTQPQGAVVAAVPTTIDDSTLRGADPVVVRDATTSSTARRSKAPASVCASATRARAPPSACVTASSSRRRRAGICRARSSMRPTPHRGRDPADAHVRRRLDRHITRRQPGLDLSTARPGTAVTVANTAISSGNPALRGGPALDWNVDASAFTTTYGAGVPAPGSGTNLDVEPDFVDAAHGDLHLKAASPLLDRGDVGALYVGETDITGAPRAIDHDCNGVAQPDIGAYEAPTTCKYQVQTPAQAGVVVPSLPLNTTTPRLTHVSLSHTRFTAHHGATLRYTLNEDAKVLGIVQLVHHHHHGADTLTKVGTGWDEYHWWVGPLSALFLGEYELPGHIAGFLKHGRLPARADRDRQGGPCIAGPAPAVHDHRALTAARRARRPLARVPRPHAFLRIRGPRDRQAGGHPGHRLRLHHRRRTRRARSPRGSAGRWSSSRRS